jgi:glycosyltransferase involved in cell wall biosynthesis
MRPLTIGHVGRETVGKRIHLLIAAMEEVWRAVPETSLVIAGAAGSGSERIRASLAQLSGAQRRRVHHLGEFDLSEKEAVYQGIDIFVSCSDSESYGLTFLEARATGCVIVGTNTPAVRELINDGVDGMLVAPQHALELAKVLVLLASSTETCNELATAGYERVAAENHPERVAWILHEYYLSAR